MIFYIFDKVYILCLSCNVKKPNTTAKLSETSIVLIVFDATSTLILLLFLTVTQHESGTRKAMSWAVTVYNKILSSQCKLTAQIEPVQDKCNLPVI